jgi:antitoxin component HigA of HigAB toxin-antitoxin module
LALVEIDRLIKIGPVEDSKEFLELDRISTIVEAYEEFHYTI